MIRYFMASGLILSLATCAQPLPGTGNLISESHAQTPDPALHESLLTLDAHLDTPALFHREGYDFSARGTYANDRTSVDLPRLQEGQLDGRFWVIYTAPGPLDEASYIAACACSVWSILTVISLPTAQRMIPYMAV